MAEKSHYHAEEATPTHNRATSPGEAILKRKSFGEGVSTDMTEGLVVANTFNASHQTS